MGMMDASNTVARIEHTKTTFDKESSTLSAVEKFAGKFPHIEAEVMNDTKTSVDITKGKKKAIALIEKFEDENDGSVVDHIATSVDEGNATNDNVSHHQIVPSLRATDIGKFSFT